MSTDQRHASDQNTRTRRVKEVHRVQVHDPDVPGLDNHTDRVAQRSRILDVEVSRGGDHGLITEPFRI